MIQRTLQRTDDELVALYLETAWADVRELQAVLRQLGERPEDWSARSQRLRELAHNIKGQGAAFGYQLMTRIGESLSVLLKGAESCDPHRLKLLGAHAASLQIVLERDITGTGGALGEALVARLGALVEKAG